MASATDGWESNEFSAYPFRHEVEELRQREALFAAAIEASPVGILVADAGSERIEFRNRAARRMLVDENDQTSMPRKWRAYRADGSLILWEEMPLLRALRRDEVIDGERVVLEFEHGERIFTEGHAAPVRDREGNVVAACVVIADVTGRLQAEEILGRMREVLDGASHSVAQNQRRPA